MSKFMETINHWTSPELEDAIQVAILELVYRSDTPIESILAGVLDSLSDWEGLRGPHLDGYTRLRRRLAAGDYGRSRDVVRAERWDTKGRPPSQAAVPNAACEAPPVSGYLARCARCLRLVRGGPVAKTENLTLGRLLEL